MVEDGRMVAEAASGGEAEGSQAGAASAAASGSEVDLASFRGAMSHLASGVTVMTTFVDGVDHAMTATAIMSVSLRPPLVLVSVDKSTRIHHALATSGGWAVSVLSADAADLATWLATKGRPLAGQLDHIPYRRDGRTGAALIADSLAWIEAETWATYDGGDHSLVVGRVLAVAERDPDKPVGRGGGDDQDAPDGQGEHGAQHAAPSMPPLVHHRGGYVTLTPSAEDWRRRS